MRNQVAHVIKKKYIHTNEPHYLVLEREQSGLGSPSIKVPQGIVQHPRSSYPQRLMSV